MFLSDFLWSWLDIHLHCESNSWTFLIKLRILEFFLLMKMSENIIFWLRLLVLLYNTRLSAVNLIFDQVIACSDKIQIKLSASESVLLMLQLYCLLILSMAVASLLARVDIKSSTCQNVNLLIRFELTHFNIDWNCLKLNSWDFSALSWCLSFYFII